MELQHHGIQGQKWGIKNGPPYPLSRTRKNAMAYMNAIHDTNRQIAQKKVTISRNEKKIKRAEKKQDISTVNELAKKGKEELKSIKLLEIQRQKIVKNAKSGGFEVKEMKKPYTYDGRGDNEIRSKNAGLAVTSAATGLIGGLAYELTDYLIAKNAGWLIDLPMYTVKVPKEK